MHYNQRVTIKCTKVNERFCAVNMKRKGERKSIWLVSMAKHGSHKKIDQQNNHHSNTSHDGSSSSLVDQDLVRVRKKRKNMVKHLR